MKTISIYLAGSIQKGHEKADSVWMEEHRLLIQENLAPYPVSFLNPAFRTDNLSDQRAVFGRDMMQVFCSDFVFVDARDRRGLGVGAEMMWAKINKIPVVTWAPRNSHYCKDQTTLLGVEVKDFIHPFVESLSDHIVSNPAEGAQWMRQALSNSSLKIKGLQDIESAMQYYKATQLETDEPMKNLLQSCEALQRKIQNLKVAAPA
jgi:hypothetical protein